MIRGTVFVARDLCKGCELCVEACPPACLALTDGFNARGYRFVALAADGCTGCGACAVVCPDAAISVFREGRKARVA